MADGSIWPTFYIGTHLGRIQCTKLFRFFNNEHPSLSYGTKEMLKLGPIASSVTMAMKWFGNVSAVGSAAADMLWHQIPKQTSTEYGKFVASLKFEPDKATRTSVGLDLRSANYSGQERWPRKLPYHRWRYLVSNYSYRSLTKKYDKLRAISALAKMVSRVRPCKTPLAWSRIMWMWWSLMDSFQYSIITKRRLASMWNRMCGYFMSWKAWKLKEQAGVLEFQRYY